MGGGVRRRLARPVGYAQRPCRDPCVLSDAIFSLLHKNPKLKIALLLLHLADSEKLAHSTLNAPQAALSPHISLPRHLSCSPLCSLFLPFYHSKWNGLEVTLTAKAPKAMGPRTTYYVTANDAAALTIASFLVKLLVPTGPSPPTLPHAVGQVCHSVFHLPFLSNPSWPSPIPQGCWAGLSFSRPT